MFLASEAFLSSFFVNLFCFLKKVSSTLALTPSRETFVEVLITYAALTLFRGTPLIAYGPLTRRFPDGKFLRTTTLLPLCFPARRITTFPA